MDFKVFVGVLASLATTAAVFSTIVNYADIVEGLCSLFRRALNFKNVIEKVYYKRKRERYYRELCEDVFMKWQIDTLKVIYEPLIKNNKHVEFTELLIGGSKRTYESVTIKLKNVEYPFEGICPKDELKTKADVNDSSELNELYNWYYSTCKRYYNLIKGTIRFPKRIGYMLDELVIEDSGNWHLRAHVDNYENNIKTSHVLEYELYKLYKKTKGKVIDNRDELLRRLKIRRYIHNHNKDVFMTGCGRASLLSVQMFVMVKNHSGSYDVLRIRRSQNVAAKAGYLQFVPSGGFESMNDCTDFDSQWSNYSISKVVFRELLEECFGIDEDDVRMSGNNVTPDKIYHNQHIKSLLDLISNNKAQMELVGITESLVSLRQELCFVLKVDDEDFAAYLTSNYESKTAIHLVDIRNLEKESFWIEGKRNDLAMLNCTSAGLFELARGSRLYKEAMNGISAH